jgi:hypothetical protein
MRNKEGQMDEKLEELAARVSVADVSSAVAFGLQRALGRRGGAEQFADKILRYGGRLIFEIEVAPKVTQGSLQELPGINEG